MPTGYTSIIAGGATFRDFATRCARAMGACVMQRDEGPDSPPRAEEPSAYHDERLQKDRARLAELVAMSPAECDAAARGEFHEALSAWQKRISETTDLRAKYDAMLSSVRAWNAPTPEHEGLRRFMIEQIEESVRFDCGTWEAPRPRTGAAWLADSVACVTRSIVYHTEERQKEHERTASRNAWIAALFESLPAE